MTGYLNGLVIPAVAGVMVSATAAAWGQDQPETTAEDQALVDMFFKDKIVAVRRSRDTADDIELIAEMLERAQSVPDSPAVQWLMYETAVDLGMTSEVYGAAIDAAMAMREAFPEADAMSDESLLVLMEQAYRSARRSDRPEVAGPYLALMLKVARAVEEAGDVDRASRLYRTGVSVSRAVRLEDEEEAFEAEVQRLNEIEQINSRIRMLSGALEANPRNSGAARELVMLYVLEKRDLSLAAEVVELTRDPDLVDAVTMGVDGAAETGPAEALRVGDWYYALSQEHEGHAAYLLGESLAFYDQFLRTYERDDALRSRVSTMRVLVASGLEEIEAEASRGEWANALAAFNPEAHAYRGEQVFLPQGRGLRLTGRSAFVVPFDTDLGYDIRLRFDCDGGDGGIIFYLPLGDEHAGCFQYSTKENSYIGLNGARSFEDESFLVSPGREGELLVRVRPAGNGRYAIACSLDGETMIEWVGSPDQLRVHESVVPPEEYGQALAILVGGAYTFESLDVRLPRE